MPRPFDRSPPRRSHTTSSATPRPKFRVHSPGFSRISNRPPFRERFSVIFSRASFPRPPASSERKPSSAAAARVFAFSTPPPRHPGRRRVGSARFNGAGPRLQTIIIPRCINRNAITCARRRVIAFSYPTAGRETKTKTRCLWRRPSERATGPTTGYGRILWLFNPRTESAPLPRAPVRTGTKRGRASPEHPANHGLSTGSPPGTEAMEQIFNRYNPIWRRRLLGDFEGLFNRHLPYRLRENESPGIRALGPERLFVLSVFNFGQTECRRPRWTH